MGWWIPMTAVPQRTAISHSLGALAATLIGVAEYYRLGSGGGRVMMTALGFEVVIGGLTFTGSLMAAAQAAGAAARAAHHLSAVRTSRTSRCSRCIVGLLVYMVVVPSASALLFYAMVGAGARSSGSCW